MRKQAVLLHRLTLAAMLAFGIWGLVMALAPIRPFWIDEWRLIYNLKFKTTAELWGPLQFTQQFPRLYLVSFKAFTQALDYSYASLRLPAFFFSIGTILLSWRITPRLFPDREDFLRPLFTLIIISSETFTYYFVQTKHYEAEIFLAVLAMWQMLQLLAIPEKGIRRAVIYLLLCISMALAPFFSYTYPIAIAPAFLIMGLHMLRLGKRRMWLRVFFVFFPLLLSIAGILVFYFFDVRQLMHDQAMHHYWANRMAAAGNRWQAAQSLWQFFASTGAGFIFELIFSVLGIAALVYGLLSLRARMRFPGVAKEWMQAYAALLLILVIALFFAGRLPLGEAKFAAFCDPALSLLIVSFLQAMSKHFTISTRVIALVLYAGLLGNVPIVICRSFGDPEYSRRMAIYRATERAITEAQQNNTPILITPGVAWPDEIMHKVAFLENITSDAVLKTFPAYSVRQGLPVYSISDTASARQRLALLPSTVGKVQVQDGEHYTWLSR